MEWRASMKKLRFYTIMGIMFVIIFGIISHFIYEWTGSHFIAGLFFPTNESTWEHMKLAFFPMLAYSLFMDYKLKEEYPCVTSSLCIGVILSTVLIPIIFYTYTGILGYSISVLNIGYFIISIVVAFIVVYRLTESCKAQKFEWALKMSVLLLMLLFFVFTGFQPNIALFMYPTV